MINIFKKEEKLRNLIKKHQRQLERGKFLDPFFRNEITVQKLVKLFSTHHIEGQKVSKILDILWKEMGVALSNMGNSNSSSNEDNYQILLFF